MTEEVDETKWQQLMDDGNAAYQRGRLAEVEKCFVEALKEAEKFEPHDSRLAYTYNNYAVLCHSQGKYAFAEEYYNKALAINEKIFGRNSIEVAKNLHNLAVVASAKGRYAEAEPLYKESFAIKVILLGPNHPDLLDHLNNHARLLRKLGRDLEAAALEERARGLG